MFRIRGMSQVIISVLLWSPVFADDSTPSDAESEPLPSEALSVEKLLAGSAYASRWQLSQPVEPAPDTGEWRRPVTDFENRDTDSSEGVTRPRTLSLLTLSRSKQSRLFFGLNEDGLLGLHLRAVSQQNADRYLGLARTPQGSEDAEANPRAE